MERICDEFIVIKKGCVIVQDDISRLKDEFFFVSLPKSGWKRGSLDLAPSHIRETESGIQMLVAQSRLRESSVSWPEGTEIRHPDLESLYFFFSSL
jgi:ABC-type multidrug transport system ATPase subunit